MNLGTQDRPYSIIYGTDVVTTTINGTNFSELVTNVTNITSVIDDKISEAPEDGKQYVRKNATWEELVISGTVDLSNYYTKTETDALLVNKLDKLTTVDDKLYGLKNGTWTEIVLSTSGSRVYVVNDITARDALVGLNVGDLVWVIDSTGDSTVTTGAAQYIVTNIEVPITFVKITEVESLDIDLTAYYTKTETDTLLNNKRNNLIYVTTEGTSTVLTATLNNFTLINGAEILITPNITNDINVTLNVNSLGAKSIKLFTTDTGLEASILKVGYAYHLVYDLTSDCFIIVEAWIVKQLRDELAVHAAGCQGLVDINQRVGELESEVAVARSAGYKITKMDTGYSVEMYFVGDTTNLFTFLKNNGNIDIDGIPGVYTSSNNISTYTVSITQTEISTGVYFRLLRNVDQHLMHYLMIDNSLIPPDFSNYYTKTDTDELLSYKLNSQLSPMEGLYGINNNTYEKIPLENYYLKTETDTLLAAKLSDAPSDTKTYGRKDGAWVEVNSGMVISNTSMYIPVTSSDNINYTGTLTGFTYIDGSEIIIKLDSNSLDNPTLNINSLGSRPIRRDALSGSLESGALQANYAYHLVYDLTNTRFIIINDIDLTNYYNKSEIDSQINALKSNDDISFKYYSASSLSDPGLHYIATIPGFDITKDSSRFVLSLDINNEDSCDLNINSLGAFPIKLRATDSNGLTPDMLHIRFYYVMYFSFANNCFVVENFMPPVNANIGIMARPEVFNYDDNGGSNVFQLTYVPKFITEALVLKSSSFVYIQEGGDYTLSGRNITINNPALVAGDKIKINYAI